MANSNPVKKKDYRDVKNPRLRTRDVLIWIHEEDLEEVTGNDISEQFSLLPSEGTSRLMTLNKWGCLRLIERGRSHISSTYEITDWGLKMAERWRKEK